MVFFSFYLLFTKLKFFLFFSDEADTKKCCGHTTSFQTTLKRRRVSKGKEKLKDSVRSFGMFH